jgi:hypothetical protein
LTPHAPTPTHQKAYKMRNRKRERERKSNTKHFNCIIVHHTRYTSFTSKRFHTMACCVQKSVWKIAVGVFESVAFTPHCNIISNSK